MIYATLASQKSKTEPWADPSLQKSSSEPLDTPYLHNLGSGLSTPTDPKETTHMIEKCNARNVDSPNCAKPKGHIGKHAAYIMGGKVMWTEMYGPATRMMVTL